MRIFITYAREDGPTAVQLSADLERSKRQVWIDRDLTGGQAWWDEILKQIRECDLYVFALSASSLRSRPCLRELEYAQALGRPLLPIKVGEVSIQQAPRVIADAQVVDYVDRTPDAVLALRDALDAAPPPPALPDPLPTPPEVPMSYFGHFREQIGTDSLDFSQQQSLLIELKNHLGREDDREDALELLGELRRRHDLAESVAAEISALLATSAKPPPPQPENPSSDPSTPSRTPPVLPAKGPKRKRTRVVAVAGSVLIASMLALPQAFPDVFMEPIPEPVSEPMPEPVPEPTPEPEPQTVGCPVVADEFSIPFPETEYGPFGDGYYIVWHEPDAFSVYDPFLGDWLEFASVEGQAVRDIWEALLGSPFEVCVDSEGSVFGQYVS